METEGGTNGTKGGGPFEDGHASMAVVVVLSLLRPVLQPRLCYVLQLLAGGCVMCYSFWRGAVLCVTAFGGGLCYVLQPP